MEMLFDVWQKRMVPHQQIDSLSLFFPIATEAWIVCYTS